MLVEDLMVRELVTCDVDGSLQDAAELMLRHQVGSVIVTRDGDPFGIVTETDMLEAGATTRHPFDELPLEEVVSTPLVTTTGDATVRAAVNLMREHGIKKLPVLEGLELVGIVSRTDIVFHYGDFIREAHALDERRDRWEA